MATPDFTYKPDATIISAFQNAQQMKMQQEEMERKKQMDSFNLAVDTSKAIGGLVSSFVQAAEERKTNKLMDQAKSLIAEKGATQIPTAGPVQEGAPALPTGPDPRSVAQRKLALDLMQKTDKDAFAKQVGKIAFPEDTQGALSGRDIQQFWMVSPDGKQRFSVRYDEVNDTMTNLADGSPIDRSKMPGWQMVRATPIVKQNAAGDFSFLEPTTGTQTGTVSSGAQPVPKEKYGTVKTLNDPLVPENDRKEILSRTGQIENDESIKNAKKLVPTLDNVIRFMDTNNKVAMDRLGGLVQKLVAMDSGALAAWEQRDPNARDVVSRIQQLWTMQTRGELAPTAKQELKNLLEITAENLKENVQQSAGVTLNRLEAAYPQMDRKYLEELAGLKDFYGYISNPKRNVSGQKKAPSITSIDEARKLTPEQRRARIAELEAQRSK